jgi:ubiquinone/menaquinone biosynthesis C-methylase UbiE
VLDLGSGSGTDSFLAALAAGSNGHVLGVDMTDAQLAKARHLADEHGFGRVEFRKGYIEAHSVDAGSCNCVISNGVINLSPDKPAVFAAAARALRPGGRLALADIVTAEQLPVPVPDARPTRPLRKQENPDVIRVPTWRDPDSNRGHHDFQSCALPTELSRQRARRLARLIALDI